MTLNQLSNASGLITHSGNQYVICQQYDKEGTNLVHVGENGLDIILDYCK